MSLYAQGAKKKKKKIKNFNLQNDPTIHSEERLVKWEEESALLVYLYYLLQVNTIRSEFLSQGMNHNEGGWPKVYQALKGTESQ